MQHRKTQGKTIAARREDGAVAFPTFDAVDVDGTAVAFPALLKRRVKIKWDGKGEMTVGAERDRGKVFDKYWHVTSVWEFVCRLFEKFL